MGLDWIGWDWMDWLSYTAVTASFQSDANNNDMWLQVIF